MDWKDSAVVTAKMMFPLNSHKPTASSAPWIIKISLSLCSLHKQITHKFGDEDRKCIIQLWPRQQAQLSGVVKKQEVYTELHFPMAEVLIEANTVAHIYVWDFIAERSLKQWGKKRSTISEHNNSSLSGDSSSVKPGMLRKVVICQNLKF